VTQNERTPAAAREGVRSGILTSIKHDVELRGGRTAQRLAAAGIAGVVGSIGVTLFISRHPFGHHPPWHMVVFSAVWAGLLVVGFAIAFLGVRTPSLPLAHSAEAGILGLGLAGISGALCPEPHFLRWWSGTAIGSSVEAVGGLAASALCFGMVTALCIGAISAFLVLGNRNRTAVKPLLPSATLVVLLTPGVALQSFDSSLGVFVAWLAGTAAGAFAGVSAGIRARARTGAQRTS